MSTKCGVTCFRQGLLLRWGLVYPQTPSPSEGERGIGILATSPVPSGGDGPTKKAGKGELVPDLQCTDTSISQRGGGGSKVSTY